MSDSKQLDPIKLSSEIRNGYKEIELVQDPDGILGIISQRVSGPPLFTVAIFKVFERDGEMQKSIFFNVIKQANAVRRVLLICEQKAVDLECAAIEADAKKRDQQNGRATGKAK